MKKIKTEGQYQKKAFSDLEKKLQISFRDKNNLIQSFVHRSFLNEDHDFNLEHNERLEFLGDAVLEFLTTKHLYCHYDNTEGEMTRWRSSLVNTKTLAQIAYKFNFQDYLLLSRGEKNNKVSDNILANTMEAFIGALYLDQGIEKVESFLEKNIFVLLPDIIESAAYLDAKSELQEITQSVLRQAPVYDIVSTQGPDHNKKFKVSVSLDGKILSVGTGSSKQEAEQDAATKALKFFKKST